MAMNMHACEKDKLTIWIAFQLLISVQELCRWREPLESLDFSISVNSIYNHCPQAVCPKHLGNL